MINKKKIFVFMIIWQLKKPKRVCLYFWRDRIQKNLHFDLANSVIDLCTI